MISSNNLKWYNWIEYFVLSILMGIGTGGMVIIFIKVSWLDVLWTTILAVSHITERI